MNVLSLFSGIGGLDIGLERAGMCVVAQCEIDPFCRAVLAKHWPKVPLFEDVRLVTAEAVSRRAGPVDLVCGGFPCTDISVAGKGAGIMGERSGLWWEMRRIIEAVRPAWVLVENVPALRTRGSDAVLSSLEGLGYACWPLVVGAWAVGAPHRRDRVWIVAKSQSGGCNAGCGVQGNEGRAGLGGSEPPRGVQLVHGDSDPLRLERERAGGDRAATAVASNIGPDMANPERAGLRTGWISDQARADRGSAGLANTQPAGLGGHGPDAGCAPQSQDWDCGAHGLADPVRLPGGRGAQEPRRIPFGRAFARWPSRPGERQFEWERPRLVESAVGGPAPRAARRLAGFARRNALRALGNCVVPAVAEEIGRVIVEVSG